MLLEKRLRENRTRTFCVSSELSLQFCMEMEALRKKLRKCSVYSLEKIQGSDAASFQDVCWNDISIVKDLIQVNIFLFDRNIVDGAMIAKFARRNVGKHSNTVGLLSYNSHIGYVFEIKLFFKGYWCVTCDTFFNRAANLDRLLTTCSKEIIHEYSKNMYQPHETLFDKIDSIGMLYTDNQNLSSKMAFLDCESICVKDDNSKDTEKNNMVCEAHSNFGIYIVQLDTRIYFLQRFYSY